MSKRTLTPEELGTILAALRVYQQALAMNGDEPPRDVAEIATDGDTIEPLGADEIDGLCEAINCGEVTL